ncbi:MAG TPA: CPBP family intramembrane glutamic endopeptidase [Roseiflexaceae bacterium]|nr:CPBP family intramembrane glutamic endopeptidase [Roseiflexaceae bacterium]
MRRIVSATGALFEVITVFGLAVLVFRIIAGSPLGTWERQALQRPFLEYLAVMAVPLVLLILARRDFAAYGIALHNLKPQLAVAAIGFLPVAAIALVLNVVNWRRWEGALLVLLLEAVLLLVLAWLVRNQPTAERAPAGLPGILLLLPGLVAGEASLAGLLLALLFNFIFVGPAEEILFRGYIQSRLNTIGRPYQFFGVTWGWGLVASALLFGAWHVVAPFTLHGTLHLAWPHGLWTFGAGLLFGFVREKTGGVVAPALLHGVLNVL